MTWLEAERLLGLGAASLVTLSDEHLARLHDDLGPVNVLALRFQFERDGIVQSSTFTVTKRLPIHRDFTPGNEACS